MDEILHCPACNGENLHQEYTKVFMRPTEDGPVEVVKTNAAGYIVNGPDSKNENPSRRRDGLIIYFSCETCSHKPKLKIYQHKGTTYVEIK